MVHFTALVLLPPDVDDPTKKVEELLSPYDSNVEVPPYREYLDQQEVEREMEFLAKLPAEQLEAIAVDWEVSSNDLEGLAKARLDWFEEGGVDEKGSYQIVTYNPQGKWDWYNFITAEPLASGGSIPYPCQVSELPKVIPYAIVTPDGQWHELGIDAGVEVFSRSLRGDSTTSQEEVQWEQRVEEILALCSNNLAMGLNCHC